MNSGVRQWNAPDFPLFWLCYAFFLATYINVFLYFVGDMSFGKDFQEIKLSWILFIDVKK